MPKYNNTKKKTPKHTPLTPTDSEPYETSDEFDKTQLHIPEAKSAPQHTSRIPAPADPPMSKRKTRKSTADDAPHSIFKPRTKNPNFALSVAVTTLQLCSVLILCACLALAGVLVGIAKAYVDTAPTLDLAAIDAQDKTSFIYDSKGNLITDYKGTENRITVARKEFNDATQTYNVAVRKFPANIIAAIFDFDQKPYYEADQSAAEAPKVEF